jgi:PAS domain S-box-containing protein/putative nucleotidyltransferase with HDIG domain
MRGTFGDGPANVAFITDTTQQRRAEEELTERDSQFRTFVEQAPVAISVSRGGKCLYANRKFADLVGWGSADELVGAPIDLFYAPHMQAESRERTRRRSLGLATPPEYESVFQRFDGSQFPVHLAVGPVQLQDGGAHIAFVTDISDRQRADRAQRESEVRRDTAERVALAGSWCRDLRTNAESWSDGMFALFDVGPGDFDGRPTPILETRVPAADLGPLLGLSDRAVETGEPVSLVFRVVHRDGAEHVMYTEGTVERDETGRAAAVTGYTKDITELFQGRARLEAAAVEWSETFDAMSDAVAVLDGDGRIMRCNAATLDMTGLYIDDIAGSSCDEVFHDLDSAGSLQQRAFETGQAHSDVVEHGGRWLRMSCRPRLDAAGRVKGGVFVATDISPLRQAEQAALERTHFLEQLLKAVPVPVYCIDATRHMMVCNDAFGASVGRTADELIGKTVFDVRPAEFAERMDEVDRQLVTRPGAVLEAEFDLPGPDGAVRYTLGHKAVFSDVSGKPAGIVGVNLDVTKMRQAEKQLVSAAAQLRTSLESAVAALGATTELRDPYTAGHQRRVAQLADAIAVRLDWDDARIGLLDIAARLHDIGKVVVPAVILAKPGRLSEAEMQIIRQHPGAGAEIVGTIGFDPDVATMVRQHHERLDGSGYPDGLHGAEILADTLILSVADVVEAMISDRPYRPGLPIEAAVAELRAGAGLRYEARACAAAISLISAEGFRLGSSLTF